MQPNDDKCSPAKNVSNEKRSNLSSSFKRYRRKSLAPQFDQLDDLDNEQKANEIQEQEEEEKRDNERVKVCEFHRKKAINVQDFEYSCTKCHCYCTEEEKA